MNICLSADAIGYPEGGGHTWVYLNWALSLQALGCRVIWLERVNPQAPPAKWQPAAARLAATLRRHGLAGALALYQDAGGRPVPGAPPDALSLTEAAEADALISLRYGTGADIVARFRRSALIDIDPGLLQMWLAQGHMRLPGYDAFFTIGENVTGPDSRVPATGHAWRHTPPCVALDAWPVQPAPADAPFTAVTHWYANEWVVDGGETYANDKRTGYLPFLDLPRLTRVPLELALNLGGDTEERAALERRGWRIREATEVAGNPDAYREYIGRSRGEFGCAKPSCLRFKTAWISDRSLCYLASGRPVVVQHTGPSRYLPDGAGLFRFHDPAGAAAALEAVVADYGQQSILARRLAEDYFDGRKVAGRVLEAVV